MSFRMALKPLMVSTALFVFAHVAAAQAKVAVINLQKAVLESAEIKAASAAMEARYKPRVTQIETLDKELAAIQQNLQTNQGKLTEQAVTDLNAQGTRKQRDVQRLRDDLDRDARQRACGDPAEPSDQPRQVDGTGGNRFERAGHQEAARRAAAARRSTGRCGSGPQRHPAEERAQDDGRAEETGGREGPRHRGGRSLRPLFQGGDGHHQRFDRGIRQGLSGGGSSGGQEVSHNRIDGWLSGSIRRW